MAAKDTYRGINDMYYREPVKEQKSSKKTEETETSPEKKKPDPEYSITSLEIAALSQGFRMNKPYLVRGKVSKIAKDIKHKRVIIAVNAEYDSVKEDLCPYAEATIKDDLTFLIELKELRWHSKCYKDCQNGKDVQFAAWATASGTTAQKSTDSAKVMLPDPKAFITLKKGN